MESLAKQLNIAENEVKEMAARVNFMLNIRNERPFKSEHEQKIFEEWITIAKRLRKGGEMIRATESSLPREEWEHQSRFNKLVNLYTFLLRVLGFYDNYVRSVVSEASHKQMQSTVLEILLD
jgi:hypothetical protein